MAGEMYKNKWAKMGIVSLGVFAIGINTGIISLANPTLTRVFDIGIDQIQWVSTIFTLVVISLMLLFGRIGDQTDNYRIYNGGVLCFIMGSLCCGLSGSFAILLTGRAIQAVGAAMLMANSMAIISSAFPVKERGRALGISGVAVGLGTMSGPSVGGLILDSFNWNAIFFVNIPFGIVAFILGMIYLRSESPPGKTKLRALDLNGSLFLAVIASSLVLSLSGGFSGSGWFILLFAASIPAFIYYEKRHSSPIWNFELLRNTRFSLGNVLTFLIYFTQTTVYFLMPFYMEGILDMPIGTMGLMMIILPLTMAVVAPLSGMLSDKIGAMRLLPIAFLLMLLSFACLFFLSDSSPFWHIAVGLGLMGVGVGFCVTPNNSEVMTAAGSKYAGYAGGFVATTRNLAFCIGTAASAGGFSSLLNLFSASRAYEAAYVAALRWIIAATALFAIAGIFVCFRLKRVQSMESATLEIS